MDVTTILKSDHRKVDELFSQIEAASERAMKTRLKIFLKVKKELTVHAAAEEQILYPRMQESRTLRHYAFEAYEEHRLVKQLLAEISALDLDGNAGSGDAWNAKVKVLMELVKHHVREEEGPMFRGLKSELERDELRQMGEALESFKQSYREPPGEAEAEAVPARAADVAADYGEPAGRNGTSRGRGRGRDRDRNQQADERVTGTEQATLH